jgi:hypothetical protein
LPRFIIHNSSFILACRPPVRLQQSQIIGRISASFNFKRVNAEFSPNNAHILKAVLFQGLFNVILVE